MRQLVRYTVSAFQHIVGSISRQIGQFVGRVFRNRARQAINTHLSSR